MGASYSTELAGATERQKERYGVFSLRTKQKQSLVVIEDLIDELMNTKNVNSLMSLFTPGSDQIKCTDMFIVLSSTLKKEFQLFKFPDPVRPSEISDIAYLPRSVYDAKYKDDYKRNELCNNIAWFMVRFTTLIFALASSLKVPQTLSFDISKPLLIVPPVLNGIELKFNFELIDGHGNVDFLPNLVFIGNSSVIIDKKSSVIFTPGDKTKVGSFEIKEIKEAKESPSLLKLRKDLVDLQTNPHMQQQYGYASIDKAARETYLKQQILIEENRPHEEKYLVTIYECDQKGCKLKPSQQKANAAPATVAKPTPRENVTFQNVPTGPAAPPEPPGSLGHSPPPGPPGLPGLPGLPGPRSTAGASSAGLSGFVPGGASSVGSQSGGRRRKTRRISNNNRRKTYKQRGGTGEIGLPIGAKQFILYKNGMTSLLDSTDTTKIPFNERVKQILNTYTFEFRSDENPYIPLGQINSNVIARMISIANILKKQVNSTEGTSPAQYRAYVLATQTEEAGKKLKVSFCEDIWAEKQVTRVLPYALLDALFKDKIGNVISSSNGIEYEKIVNQFVNHKMMMKQDESSIANTFDNLKFTSAKSIVPIICSRTEYSIDNNVYIETLMEGHKALRDLYDTHIQSVVQFITTKLIAPKFRGYKEPPQWTINSIFSNDSRGALATLESIIKEGRTMLVKHYFAVESIYIKTLEKLKEMGTGLANLPANPLSPNLFQAPSSEVSSE